MTPRRLVLVGGAAAIAAASAGFATTPIHVSEDFAARFPAQVRLVRFPACRHTQEWNSRPELWEGSGAGWLPPQQRGAT